MLISGKQVARWFLTNLANLKFESKGATVDATCELAHIFDSTINDIIAESAIATALK